MKLSEGKINDILDCLEVFDTVGEGWQTIDESCEDSFGREKVNEELKKLYGFQYKFEADGDHSHDGQMVEYDITFKSPSGKLTEFSTEMCLMIGWNIWGEITIKE